MADNTSSNAQSEHSAAPHQENATLGGILIVVAFLCVAIMSALGKAAANVSTGTIVFFQNFVSLLLFLPWVFRHGASGVKTSRTWLHVLRTGSGLLSQVLMFAAVKKMPLMNAVLLTNSAPLFIPLITGAGHEHVATFPLPIQENFWSQRLLFAGHNKVRHPQQGAFEL